MPEFGAQSIEPRQQNLETFRTVSFSGKKSSNRFRAANLPEARDEPPQGLGRLLHCIRIAKTLLATDSPQSVVFEGFRQSVGFTEIPGFQLLTHNSHGRVSAACVPARLQESPLQTHTVAAIVVSQDDKANAWFPPRSQLAGDALLQVAFPFVR